MDAKNKLSVKNEIELVKKALLGNKKALTEIIESVENLIYNLSIKMLWHPQDAEDASQEILIRVITNLKSFCGKSKFSTWVYRLATNHLLTLLNKKTQLNNMSFSSLSKELEQGLLNELYRVENSGEQDLLVQEMKIGCTNGMLQCLDANTRTSYILGDILGFNSKEGAYIQHVEATTFRKRLSRGRTKLFTFMNANCGVANKNNNCRCKKQLTHCIHTGKIKRSHFLFATDGSGVELKTKIDEAEKSLDLFNTNPSYRLPENAVNKIRKVLDIHF